MLEELAVYRLPVGRCASAAGVTTAKPAETPSAATGIEASKPAPVATATRPASSRIQNLPEE